MLNSTAAWEGVERLQFFITYSNDIDAAIPNVFVGDVGENKWVSVHQFGASKISERAICWQLLAGVMLTASVCRITAVPGRDLGGGNGPQPLP